MKKFSQQFTECHEQGFHENTIEQPLTPRMFPVCPSIVQKFKEKNITTLSLIECGRFGGVCSSRHPQCKELRGWNIPVGSVSFEKKVKNVEALLACKHPREVFEQSASGNESCYRCLDCGNER